MSFWARCTLKAAKTSVEWRRAWRSGSWPSGDALGTAAVMAWVRVAAMALKRLGSISVVGRKWRR